MKLVSKLALAAALAAPSLFVSSAFAQDAAATTAKPNVGALTFSGGVDVASNYYFRGYLQENSGLIVQPYFGVATTLVEADDFKLGLSVSTWNSIHSEHTGVDGSGPDAWYENDIYVSLPVSFGDFTITPSYYLYQYPNGAFNSVHELLLTVSWDDTKAWKDAGVTFYDDFALKPYATIAYELDDGNGSEDTYAEVGIAPTYVAKFGDYNIPLTIPIALGLSIDDYYVKDNGDNDVLGYLSAGVQTSVPIPESIIPAKYGSWAVTGGAYYMTLFSDSAEVANNDSSNVFWGKVGLTFSY
jgi:hypothetical protein